MSRTLRDGNNATLIVYGALVERALIAAEELASEGINVEVIDARFRGGAGLRPAANQRRALYSDRIRRAAPFSALSSAFPP